MAKILESYETADSAFKNDAVLNADNDSLLKYLYGLSNQNNTNTGTQHRDVIRGLTINSLLLKRHMDTLNEGNQKTQRIVLWLAGVAVISALVQVYLQLQAPSPRDATEQTKQEVRSANPSPVKPQASDPVSGQKP